MSTTSFLKRDLPLIIIFIMAAPMILYRFINHPLLTQIVTETGFWSSIIRMSAWGLGVIYLFQGEYHALKRTPTLIQKVNFATLISFSLLLVGMFFLLPGANLNKWYQWVYMGFYRAQSTAFYGLMFLYLMSASYRMLRVKSLESTILLVSGFLYIMRSTSIFTLYFPWLLPLGEWLMDYPNRAAVTGATIAASLGMVLIGVRTMLGRERTAVDVS